MTTRREASTSTLVVATHNVMDGLRLSQLLPVYSRLVHQRNLALLCIQEDRPHDNGTLPSTAICQTLGTNFSAATTTHGAGLTLFYNHTHLELAKTRQLALPILDKLNWLERRYISGGVPEQKYAQLAQFSISGWSLSVANFHLDAAGNNQHRHEQIAAIAAELRGSDVIVACGDTNVFTLRAQHQKKALARVLHPLEHLGATDPSSHPTHFFARQGEPSATHRIAAFVARAGLDAPRRYDVVCTNAPCRRRGQETTRGSDHDLTWGELDLNSR